MNSQTSVDHLQQKIFIEQISLLYKPLLPLLGVNLAISLALVGGLWELVPQVILISWLSLMSLVLLFRLGTYNYYRKNFNHQAVRLFARLFVIGSGLTGVLWGACGLLMLPNDSLASKFAIIAVLIGMGAGAVTTHHVYKPAFTVFFLPALLPISINLLSQNEIFFVMLGVMIMVYISFMYYYASILYRSHKELLRLRFENVDLVEQLKEQKEDAEQANIAKSRFLAAASHDLRQPLHALTLFTSVLNDSQQSDENRMIVSRIDASVKSLEDLFNALLDISRLDAGVLEITKQNVSLKPLFDRLFNDFNSQAQMRELKLSIPQCDYTVNSDPTLLEQILRNYMSNAIRYTEHGEVGIRCTTENKQLRISVYDTGIGIPKSEQKKIFDEYHQLKNPERDRSKGLGLGLAIVKRTASLLGHNIDMQSTPGEGSVFSISLELGDASQLAEAKPLETNFSAHPNYALNFIVIDDEECARAAMQSRLQLWGCEVISVADQDEALHTLQNNKQRIDGIIADFRLRDNRNGIEAIRAIQASIDSDVPALIVTGDIAADKLREVDDSGFQVLHKPVAPVKLHTFVRQVHNMQKVSA